MYVKLKILKHRFNIFLSHLSYKWTIFVWFLLQILFLVCWLIFNVNSCICYVYYTETTYKYSVIIQWYTNTIQINGILLEYTIKSKALCTYMYLKRFLILYDILTCPADKLIRWWSRCQVKLLSIHWFYAHRILSTQVKINKKDRIFII